MSGALARRVRTAGAAAAVLLWLGCGPNEDLAALVVSPAPDAGLFDATRPFAVLGQPWRGARPQRAAVWPLATPLRDFFAGASGPSGRRVSVSQPDREALWALRASVAAGDYGGSRASVVVADDTGDEYLVIFVAEDT